MILQRISILNYRNIAQAALEFSPNINCFIGSNGMGKTNALDAIYYLSFCRSSFTNIDSQVIRHDAEFFVVEGDYLTDDGKGKEHIYAGLKRGRHKVMRRGDKAYKKLADHIGLIPIIFISPGDNILVEGAGDGRRRLMDMAISQYDRLYLDALSRYNKALQQRNALLRMETEPDPALLDLWEEEMAKQGEIVYAKRDAFIGELIPVFQRIYDAIAQSKEKVSLRYISHCQRGPLLEVIRSSRLRDRAVGYSLHGVHRDDLEMTLDGYPMRQDGSQGQTKTYVLALKLAQFDFLKRTASQTAPILLLDDIFDKLDAGRVEQIVHLVSGGGFGQIFMTDTNREHLDRILQHTEGDHRLFHVENGEITEQPHV